MKIKTLLLLISFSTIGLHGDVIPIDFEVENHCTSEFIQSGIRITNSRGTICFHISGSNSVSNGSWFTNDTEGLKIEHTEGDTFTPISIDLAEYSISVGAPDPLLFIGKKPNGEEIFYEIILDGVADGSGNADDFQTFTFPPNFQNIISLECPARLWSVDNIIVDAIPPPELPKNQKLDAHYSSAHQIFSQQAVWQDNLIIGADFHYTSGYRSPRSVTYLAPNGVTFDATTPYYDNTTGYVVYKSGPSIYKRDRTSIELLQTLSSPALNNYNIESIGNPITYKDRFIFEGYTYTNSDRFYIFEKSNEKISELITPDTLLPSGEGLPEAKPFHFPDLRAIGHELYAFKTSLVDSKSISRVYIKRQSSDFDLVLSEGDTTPIGTVSSIESLSFDMQNRLIVEAITSGGAVTLKYGSTGLLSSTSRNFNVSPIDTGLKITGVSQLSNLGTHFLNSNGTQYHDSNGNFHKIIGVGDKLDQGFITDLRFLDSLDGSPERIIVDISFEGSSERFHYIISLASPINYLPKIGTPFIYNKNGKIYLPVSHLTADFQYNLEYSLDLENWYIEKQIDEVKPLQYLTIDPPHIDLSKFFRVMEIKKE